LKETTVAIDAGYAVRELSARRGNLPALSSDDDRGRGSIIFETAAAHATHDVPVAEPGRLVGEVRERLAGRRFDSATHVVVCRDGRFLGIVTIEDLLAAPADTAIESLMDAAPTVGPGVDQEVAAWHAVRHGESALAVVDAEGHFVGVIPPHRLVAVLLAEHEEDLSRLGGFLETSALARTTSEEPVRRRFRHRLPWLLLGLGGALLAAELIGRFEGHLRANLIVAFFMPGIVYLADAVGTQTETVIVRGLSLGVPLGQMVTRELMAGLVIGAALAALAAPAVWWYWQDPSLALSVAVSVFAASSTSTVAAILLPWIFNACSVDPAFGSGPLATVIQDLLSIWIYLLVTSLMMIG
jgi:magnesium transporter